MAEESKCVMCLTGKHPQWGEVEPAKMIDIRGEKRMRHEHTRDHMFTSLCVTEPAPDPQEPPQRLEGDCSCDGDRRCIEHLFQERADAKARKDGNQ